MMRVDLPIPVVSSLHDLIGIGKAFLDYLHGFGAVEASKRETFRSHKKELEAAELALRLERAFASPDIIAEGKIPEQLRLLVELFHTFFRTLIKRWEWQAVTGPDGEAHLLERRSAKDKEERLSERAIAAYVLDPRGPHDVVSRHIAYTAMRKGAKPDMSFEEAKAVVQAHSKAARQPWLGRKWPTCHADELERFAGYIKGIECAIQQPFERPASSDSRRRGQRLKDDERKTYLHVIRTKKRLKLPHRMAGNAFEIAKAAGVPLDIVPKALNWGRKHNLI
jgi:hypothetical protein